MPRARNRPGTEQYEKVHGKKKEEKREAKEAQEAVKKSSVAKKKGKS